MRIKIYLDEDVPVSFAHALLNRSVDVATTQEAGNSGLSDANQLVFAAKTGKVIFTHNRKDFIMLHKEHRQKEKSHSGIIVADQLPTGLLLRRFMKLWFSMNAADMKDRLEFLSNWK